MIKRFTRIKSEFGGWIYFRILLMLIGLLGMVLLDVFHFQSFLTLIIAVVGLSAGFILKNKIPDGFEYYPKIISVGLFIYGIVLFFGDRLGIENYMKLAIIAATTVIVFDLQFWSLSDPSIINQEKLEDRRKN